MALILKFRHRCRFTDSVEHRASEKNSQTHNSHPKNVLLSFVPLPIGNQITEQHGTDWQNQITMQGLRVLAAVKEHILHGTYKGKRTIHQFLPMTCKATTPDNQLDKQTDIREHINSGQPKESNQSPAPELLLLRTHNQSQQNKSQDHIPD